MKNFRLGIVCSALSILATGHAGAQPAMLVKDINTKVTAAGSLASSFVEAGGIVYFSALLSKLALEQERRRGR